MMFAVFETGGKQVKVSPGDRIKVEKLGTPVGENVVLQKILMIADDNLQVHVGSPYIEGAVIDGRVLRHAKNKKVTVFKYKPKKRYRIKTGHRQEYTLLEIDAIRIGDRIFSRAEQAVTEKLPMESGGKETREGGETRKIES